MNKFALRTGGAIIFVVLLVIFLLIGFAFAYMNGSQQQKTQAQLLAEGYQSFNQSKFDEAYQKFAEAKKTFSSTLDLYRKVSSSENHVTRDDLNELIVSVSLSAAHENFFDLKTANDWVAKAKESLQEIKAGERKNELSQTVKTAEEVSGLCAMFNAGDKEKALKELLNVEKNALPTDQDFFIFEIRLLIACGKAMRAPEVINQARELLFFATTDAGIDNGKTSRLWVMLTN